MDVQCVITLQLHSLQYGRAGGIPLSTTSGMDVHAIALSTTSSMDVHAIALSTTSSMDVHAIALSTTRRMEWTSRV